MPTEQEMIAVWAETLIPKWETDIIVQYGYAHILGDAFWKKGKQNNAKTWKQKIKTRGAGNVQSAAPYAQATPPSQSRAKHEEITLNKKFIGSRISFERDEIFTDNDVRGGAHTIEDRVADYTDIHTNYSLFLLTRDNGTGRLATIPYRTVDNTYSKGSLDLSTPGEKIPIPDKYKYFLWPGMRIDIHEPGNSTATVSGAIILGIEFDDPTYATETGCTTTIVIDQDLTVTSNGMEIYANNSYGNGIEGLVNVVGYNPVTKVHTSHMQLDPSTNISTGVWKSSVKGCNNQSISVMKHIGPLVETLIKTHKATRPTMIFNRLQMMKLRKYLEDSNFKYRDNLKLEYGWTAISVVIGGKEIPFIEDGWWSEQDEVPVFDFDEISYFYMGPSPLHVDKNGGGSAEGNAFLFKDTSKQKTYVMDLLGWISDVRIKKRRKHGKLYALNTDEPA